MKKVKLFLTAIVLTAATLVASAQAQKVSGVVTDRNGEPVAGASVVVDGTSIGVITGADGTYTINAKPGQTLSFLFYGMKPQKVEVTSANVNVTMEEDLMLLDESVVTAVGIQRSERSLGYSVTKVDAGEAVHRAEPDLIRSLDGKIPGVQISAPSGDAGSATRMTIRGNSSFLGNNQPLYVVDGVPYSNSGNAARNRAGGMGAAFGSGIATLDPNDIESMSVLKGAAAAVLYGSRAANGVVLITTKSGAKDLKGRKTTMVTYNGSVAFENIASLPVYQNSYGQGSNFQPGGANGSWGASFERVKEIPMYTAIASAYPDLAEKLYPGKEGMIPYQAYPNNVKDLFRTGIMWDHSLNVQSINEKGHFNVTGSYTSQDSYIPGSEFDRYAFSVGGSQQVSKRLRIGGNVAYTLTDQQSPVYGNNQSGEELGGMNSLARAFIMPRSWDIQNFPYQNPDGSNLLFQLSSQANNPYWAWENDLITSQQKRIVANFNATYQITSWLAADYTVGYNDYMLSRKSVINKGSRGFGGKGYISKGDSDLAEIESTFLLTANKDFGKLNVRTTLGHNYNQRLSTAFSAAGPEIINRGIFDIGNTKSQTAGESYSLRRKWGLFADILLSYDNWAFLNLSGRNDVSSTLPKANRSFFYPAVSASVVFTEALGIQSDVLNFGKVRASWAKVGNDADPYYNNGTFVTANPYMGQGIMELPTTLYDENLKPEFTSEFETGIELKFFDGRIAFDGTYYNRVSDNQIGSKTVAPTTGYESYVTNFGSIRNRGFELGLDVYPIMTNDFSWSIYTTFTRNRSEVLSLADGVDEIVVGGDFSNPQAVLRVGEPYGILKGTRIARDDKGNWLIDPASGMYINDKDTGTIGDPNPAFKTSMSNTLRYKNLSFNFMFDFQKGGCVYSSYLTDMLGRGVTKDTENRLGARILPGVYGDVDTLKPILDENGNTIRNTTTLTESDLWFSDGGQLSTFAVNSADEVAVYDATVLRLREVGLSYQLPRKWMQAIHLSGAEIGVVGRNLWFWAPNVPKYSNYDPTINTFGETNVQGIDYTSAPSTRRIAFNLKLTL